MATTAPAYDGPIAASDNMDLMPLLNDGTPAMLGPSKAWGDGTTGWEGRKPVPANASENAAAVAKQTPIATPPKTKPVTGASPLAMSSAAVEVDPVWYKDVTILWRENRWLDFFPSRTQSDSERLNAIVRFIVIGTALVCAYRRTARPLLVGIAAVGAASYLIGAQIGRREAFEPGAAPSSVRFGAETRCRVTTAENPWKNAMPGDELPTAPACLDDDAELLKNFEGGLPRELGDVFGPKGFPQQYGTMAVNNGLADTEAFADFLFGDLKTTCRQNPDLCNGTRISTQTDPSVAQATRGSAASSGTTLR